MQEGLCWGSIWVTRNSNIGKVKKSHESIFNICSKCFSNDLQNICQIILKIYVQISHDSEGDNWEWRWQEIRQQPVSKLHIRNCAASSNNLTPRCPKLSAIDVIATTFFERFYLVLRFRQFVPWVNCPCAPTPPPFTHNISRFPCNFIHRMAPQLFCRHDSPNLAESRYPGPQGVGISILY